MGYFEKGSQDLINGTKLASSTQFFLYLHIYSLWVSQAHTSTKEEPYCSVVGNDADVVRGNHPLEALHVAQPRDGDRGLDAVANVSKLPGVKVSDDGEEARAEAKGQDDAVDERLEVGVARLVAGGEPRVVVVGLGQPVDLLDDEDDDDEHGLDGRYDDREAERTGVGLNRTGKKGKENRYCHARENDVRPYPVKFYHWTIANTQTWEENNIRDVSLKWLVCCRIPGGEREIL